MEKEELEEFLKESQKIKIDLITDYSREIQRIIDVDLQQLLVVLYYQGDDFAKRKIQEYCYKLLKSKKQLWEYHEENYRNIRWLEDSKYL
ncbi:MAG: hypothetical protein FWH18_12565 [Marinilabiliaceae bacterium]|nr:hypothetical protein [Marinilabiliaceae bacterium]